MEDIRLTIEEARALYFNEDALRLPPVKLYRMDGAGLRTYYSYDKPKGRAKPKIKFYAGVTSLIHAVTPTSPFLIKWMIAQGGNDEDVKNERARYGTLMHIQFEHILNALITKSTFNLDDLPAEVAQYIDEHELINIDFNQWVSDLKQDCLGFVQFLIDYQVQPLAIEIPLKCEKYGTAGTVDLFCKIKVLEEGYFGEVYKTSSSKYGYNAGDPKKSKGYVDYYAVIDFKSTRKGVYYEHELQLHYYEAAIRENFTDFTDTPMRLYNLRPRDWRSEPAYTLTEQTGKHTHKKLKLLSDLFFMDNDLSERSRTLIGGLVDFSKPDTSLHHKRVSMQELVTNKF